MDPSTADEFLPPEHPAFPAHAHETRLDESQAELEQEEDPRLAQSGSSAALTA